MKEPLKKMNCANFGRQIFTCKPDKNCATHVKKLKLTNFMGRGKNKGNNKNTKQKVKKSNLSPGRKGKQMKMYSNLSQHLINGPKWINAEGQRKRFVQST